MEEAFVVQTDADIAGLEGFGFQACLWLLDSRCIQIENENKKRKLPLGTGYSYDVTDGKKTFTLEIKSLPDGNFQTRCYDEKSDLFEPETIYPLENMKLLNFYVMVPKKKHLSKKNISLVWPNNKKVDHPWFTQIKPSMLTYKNKK
jgi:hypothetical protein